MIYLRCTPPLLPFLLTHSASPSVFSAPAAKCPAASLRLQSPIRPHLPVSFQQPHIHRGCAHKKKTTKKQNHTHTQHMPRRSLPPALTVLTHVFTVSHRRFSHSPFVSTESARLRRGATALGDRRGKILSAPLLHRSLVGLTCRLAALVYVTPKLGKTRTHLQCLASNSWVKLGRAARWGAMDGGAPVLGPSAQLLKTQQKERRSCCIKVLLTLIS